MAHACFPQAQPLANSKESGSWLAVKLLHNTTLYYDAPFVHKMDHDQSAVANTTAVNKRAVHLSTLQIPSSYESVLAIVPGLHQRPPVLPEPDDPLLASPAPPKQGFDLVLHVVCLDCC
jgi:pyroglutamyl-peptidase